MSEQDKAAFTRVHHDAATIRETIARAVESVLPPGCRFKISNITVDNSRVRRDHMVLEVREKQDAGGPVKR